MYTLDDLLNALWSDYAAMTPQAARIHNLMSSRGERIVNDHIAMRTYGDSRLGLDVLAASFERHGYVARDNYEFTAKKLRARHFEHPDPSRPKVFISELKLEEFSDGLQSIVAGLLEQIGPDIAAHPDLPVAGRLWAPVRYDVYETLLAESEYAGWVAAHGLRANHFTVSLNALTGFTTLAELNVFLTENGFRLNAAAGEIKGTPDQFLEQSSTLADIVTVDFADGPREIPGCYCEFAKRYVLPDGTLFQGFVAKSADRIFESTDRN